MSLPQTHETPRGGGVSQSTEAGGFTAQASAAAARTQPLDLEDFDNLPDEMRHAKRWLVWRLEPGDTKPLKVPYWVNGRKRAGTQNGPEDLANLATFAEAVAAFETGRFDGLGFACGPDGTGNYWQAIDLDNLPERPHLREIADEMPGFTDDSPSGTGRHAYGYGRRFDMLKSNASGIEAFCPTQFVTVTCANAGTGKVECLADYVENVLAPMHSPTPSQEPAGHGPAPIVAGEIPDGGRDNTLASLAGTMRRRGMTQAEILAALRVANTERCRPPLPDADVQRIARSIASYDPADPALGDGTRPPAMPDTLATAMRGALKPITAEEWEAAKLPHPHAFMGDGMGLFPEREATVIGAPGREGKTLATIALAVAYVLGRPVAGLLPPEGRSVVIYSAEDDRLQYAAKLLAQRSLLTPEESAIVAERVIVADLKAPSVAEWRELVQVVDRRPKRAPSVAALVDALQGMASGPHPPGLVIFETGSTLSEAEEDGTGHRVMMGAVKEVADQTGLAAVLVHHTSQAASNNLPTLSVSVNDIRGATQLVFNSRQNLLLVNLGSDDSPFHESDMRTMLRRLVAPGYPGRVVVLVPLDTSKARDPRPVFLRWEPTDYGPALRELPRLPPEAEGLHWRRLLAVLRGQRVEARQEAKQSANDAKVAEVVAAVERLADKGEPASARRVSLEAGHAAGWADRYLVMAVDAGLLTRETAKIPNTKGETAVYAVPPPLADAA